MLYKNRLCVARAWDSTYSRSSCKRQPRKLRKVVVTRAGRMVKQYRVVAYESFRNSLIIRKRSLRKWTWTFTNTVLHCTRSLSGNFIKAKNVLAVTSNMNVSNVGQPIRLFDVVGPNPPPLHHAPPRHMPLPTPIKISKLEFYLDGCPPASKRYLLDGFLRGFSKPLTLWQCWFI